MCVIGKIDIFPFYYLAILLNNILVIDILTIGFFESLWHQCVFFVNFEQEINK